jgi:4-hydroxy-tetrahydrodipicolinate reductase
MGQEVCRAIAADPALDLVAAVDPLDVGIDLRAVIGVDSDLLVAADATEMTRVGVDAVVDFTVAHAALDNARFCADNGIHAVIGTSGFSDDDIAELQDRFSDSNFVIAPNFAIGAVLLMRFAEMAAPLFESAEIIELHHENKVDAPSGTATATAQRMAAASADWLPDPTEKVVYDGARGGKGPADIPVHSVRLRGLVAHQEVIFGTTGQTLTMRHDSLDRSSFMPGVVLALKRIADHPGVTVGLDALLDL